MKKWLLALLPAFLLAAYLATFFAVVATEPASALRSELDVRGEARVAAASALPALAQQGADVVVLAAPSALPAAEQKALQRFAEAGGTLLLVGPDPAIMAPGVRVHPGLVYGEGGAPPRLQDSTDALPGARSLDLGETSFTPLAQTDGRTFRDSDGDGKLSLGEPAGPFTVAAEAIVGAGRVVLVGVEDPDALAKAPNLLDAALGGSPGRIVLVEPHGAWAVPALVLVHAAALSSASLLAAAALLLAAAGVLAWLMGQADASQERARSALDRLVEDYHSKLSPGEENA